MSVAALAAREGVSEQTIYRWRQRLLESRKEEGPAFVEMTRGPSLLEVVLRSGRVLRVSESINPASLRRIAEALEDEPTC